MNKTELRKKLRIISENLDKKYKAEASSAITEKAVGLPLFKRSESVFVYISTDNEPCTLPIIEEAWRQGKTVYVPKCISKETMQAVKLNSFDELTESTYGILEPSASNLSVPNNFDISIVPCVSAWTDGRRLGHGAGYYDRFLEDKSTIKICLCFEKLLCNEIPAERQDIYMDYVITEGSLNEIKRSNNTRQKILQNIDFTCDTYGTAESDNFFCRTCGQYDDWFAW